MLFTSILAGEYKVFRLLLNGALLKNLLVLGGEF